MTISHQEATGVNAVSMAADVGARPTISPLPSFVAYGNPSTIFPQNFFDSVAFLSV